LASNAKEIGANVSELRDLDGAIACIMYP
jgi:hypothetical protein